jgi:hypothetical protein
VSHFFGQTVSPYPSPPSAVSRALRRATLVLSISGLPGLLAPLSVLFGKLRRLIKRVGRPP